MHQYQDWDYIDQRRMVVQRQAIPRQRPAFNVGWISELKFTIIIPEYIDAQLFHEVLALAGRVIGTADSRPTYGRFQVNGFQIVGLS